MPKPYFSAEAQKSHSSPPSPAREHQQLGKHFSHFASASSAAVGEKLENNNGQRVEGREREKRKTLWK